MNPIIPTDAIFIHDNQVMTNTIKVSEAFGRLHKNILQKFESLDCSDQFAKLHFKLCLKNSELQNGKPQPYYEMDFSGFMFLVMGFTGKKAAQIKEAYINAFNMMADELKTRAPSTFASIMGQTIGTDGFHCLAGVLEGKVRHLPLPDKKRVKNHIWSQVHKAFSVVSAQDIPADKLDSARNFIAAYQVLEGELLIAGHAKQGDIPDVDDIEYINAWLRVAAHRHRQLMEIKDESLKLSQQINEITQKLNFVTMKLFDPIREPIAHMPRPKGYSADRANDRATRFIKMQEGIA